MRYQRGAYDIEAPSIHADILQDLYSDKYLQALSKLNDFSFNAKKKFQEYIESDSSRKEIFYSYLQNLDLQKQGSAVDLFKMFNKIGLLKGYFRSAENLIYKLAAAADNEKLLRMLQLYQEAMTSEIYISAASLKEALNFQFKLPKYADKHSILEWILLLGKDFFAEEVRDSLGFHDITEIMKSLILSGALLKFAKLNIEELRNIYGDEENYQNSLMLLVAQLRAINDNGNAYFFNLPLSGFELVQFERLEDKYYQVVRSSRNSKASNEDMFAAIISAATTDSAFHKSFVYLAHLLLSLDLDKVIPKRYIYKSRQEIECPRNNNYLPIKAHLMEADDKEQDYFLKILFLSGSKKILEELILRDYDNFFAKISRMSGEENFAYIFDVVPGLFQISLDFAYDSMAKSLICKLPAYYKERQQDQLDIISQGGGDEIQLSKEELERLRFLPYKKYEDLLANLQGSYCDVMNRMSNLVIMICFLYEAYNQKNSELDRGCLDYLADTILDITCFFGLLTLAFVSSRYEQVKECGGKVLEGKYLKMRESMSDKMPKISTNLEEVEIKSFSKQIANLEQEECSVV